MKGLSDVVSKWNEMHSHDWASATIAFWLVWRRMTGTKAVYRVKSASVGDGLKKSLFEAIDEQIGRIREIDEYQAVMTNQDDRAFWARVEEVDDLGRIADLISKGSGAQSTSKLEDVSGAWAYVLQLQVGENSLYVHTKIRGGWNTALSQGWFRAFFSDGEFEVLDQEHVFNIPKKIDFVVYDGNVFVLDVDGFEIATNRRDGLLLAKAKLVEELKSADVLDNVDEFVEMTGDRKRVLRRLALVLENGYYRNPEYMKRLERLCKRKRMSGLFRKGRIVVTLATVDDVVMLLNNDMLKSEVNEEEFVVEVKRKIARGG